MPSLTHYDTLSSEKPQLFCLKKTTEHNSDHLQILLWLLIAFIINYKLKATL